MDDLVDDDEFSVELPIFVICDDDRAKQEGAFPIAGGLTAGGDSVVYIFTDSDLAQRCLDDNRESSNPSCVVRHCNDPFEFIAMLEIAIEKHYQFVAIDPATEREVTRRVFPIEHILAQVKRSLHDQA